MPIDFIKKYGPDRSVTQYIDFIGIELRCQPKVVEKAKEMYFHLAKISTYIQPTPRMMAATLIFLSAKDEHQYIYSDEWKDKGIAAYNALIEHAKNLIPLLKDRFPGLKNVKIGKQ